jgi:hypothetical protein
MTAAILQLFCAQRAWMPASADRTCTVPWARSGFTLLFEALVMLLCREMPMAAGLETSARWLLSAYHAGKPHLFDNA